MYLVRKVTKTGQVQVYKIDGLEINRDRKVRKRQAKGWAFNKGFAAIGDNVQQAYGLMEIAEKTSAQV